MITHNINTSVIVPRRSSKRIMAERRMRHLPTASTSPLEQVTGIVERITFHNPASGFCVLRIQAKGHRDLLTVIGMAAAVTPGESIEAMGQWVTDKMHGLQFKAQRLSVIAPNTLAGIEKYLGSGMVKGIGPHFAKILVCAFGEAIFEIIEQDTERLMALPGIGKKRKAQILASWAEQKSIRAIMVFLQSHGVGTARAVRIYKTYGDQAIEKVKANPYCLALEVYGIGFKTADELAGRLGIAHDSPLRAQAGVRHVLQTLAQEGHCGALPATLQTEAVKLLGIPESVIAEAIQTEIEAERLIQSKLTQEPVVFLPPLYSAEVGVAERLMRLLKGPLPWGKMEVDKALPWVEQQTGLRLSSSQRTAVSQALQSKVHIITGGPGVGKTTVVNSILKILQQSSLRIALCAPTGRAAKRLAETTRLPAKTIHRLLEFQPQTFSFKYHANFPLPIDLLVVDEASMLDIILMHQLLKALPVQAALLLIGDVDQLPSVGPGRVLADLMASKTIPTSFLTEIFRQASTSRIIVNAHRIQQGKLPLEAPANQLTDFYTIPIDTTEAIPDKLLHITTERIPERFGLHPIHDIQILTPMNSGAIGTRALNTLLQQTLNGQAHPTVTRFGCTFAPGDKVIQQVNNYDKDVFNGDIGYIADVCLETSTLMVTVDGRPIEYDFQTLDELALAYAISIHKSQGSEYPAVVIPLAMAHYRLLARNLLYTGITRGKKLVVLIGQPKALAIAVRTVQAQQRLTQLAQRLCLQKNADHPTANTENLAKTA